MLIIRKAVLEGPSLPTSPGVGVLCVTMVVLQEQLWGHSEDLLIAGAQQEPSPDLLCHLHSPRDAARTSKWGSPGGHSLAPSQAAPHKSHREKLFSSCFFSSCFLRRRAIRRLGTPCQTTFLGGNNRILKKHTQDPEPQSCFLLAPIISPEPPHHRISWRHLLQICWG